MARTKQTARLIEGSLEFLVCDLTLFFLFTFVVMAFIKRAVLRTDSGAASEGEAGGSQPS